LDEEEEVRAENKPNGGLNGKRNAGEPLAFRPEPRPEPRVLRQRIARERLQVLEVEAPGPRVVPGAVRAGGQPDLRVGPAVHLKKPRQEDVGGRGRHSRAPALGVRTALEK
jgi:hypothetical protein